MKKQLLYFLALLTTLSCVDKSSQDVKLDYSSNIDSKKSVTDWSKVEFIKEPCEKSEIEIDSTFKFDSTSFSIKIELVCLEDYKVRDSSILNLEDRKGEFSPLYSNYKYSIQIKKGDLKIESSFRKEELTNSLSADFVNNAILGTINFKEHTDSTYTFSGFIGYPYTDSGWMFDFSIDKNGKSKILRTYDIEYGN